MKPRQGLSKLQGSPKLRETLPPRNSLKILAQLRREGTIETQLYKRLALRWSGDSQSESAQFARIDSQKNPYFHNVRAIRRNRLKPADSQCFSPLKRDSQKGVQFGNPETIRENQTIRANLRIDSRESGHLSLQVYQRERIHLLFGNFPCILPKEGNERNRLGGATPNCRFLRQITQLIHGHYKTRSVAER